MNVTRFYRPGQFELSVNAANRVLENIENLVSQTASLNNNQAVCVDTSRNAPTKKTPNAVAAQHNR